MSETFKTVIHVKNRDDGWQTVWMSGGARNMYPFGYETLLLMPARVNDHIAKCSTIAADLTSKSYNRNTFEITVERE